MTESCRIIDKGPNEFVFEYATEEESKELKIGWQFIHENALLEVTNIAKGLEGPIFTFLVLTKTVHK